ncbi:Gamma-glutamyl peptidase 3 [Dichanthelium oligosanthes]|uniref:Gamma-glutamyl peptidase 3 n=1 Tax=Dichanthelium oligosanthes TaxID=888268 RepID=A0A1E5VSS1_9POAL|nr:Gamma-glutamyl peptidase 3 [Dichanthelium oligosanthes]
MTAAAKPAARRYALLLALWDSDYAKKVYGGYCNVFVSAFGAGEGERWDCFRVIAGEFPAPEDLASYDGFVVSGSPHDAHGDEPWVRCLCALVQTLHAMRKRVLGICFGHQVLCRALGGRLGRARGGWDVGVRTVTFAQGLDHLGLEFLGDLEDLPRSAAIVEVHQDEGHPEYTTDILHNLIDRLTAQNDIPRSVGDEARLTAAETGGPDDRAFWTGLCKSFLSGGGGLQMSSPRALAPEVTGRPAAVVGSCFAGAPAMVQLACRAGIN